MISFGFCQKGITLSHKRFVAVTLVVSVCLMQAAFSHSDDLDKSRYMSLDEVKPGVTGYGKTVFKGSAVENFSIEVVDVLRNVKIGRSVILIKLTDEKVKETGVVSGMSGSPIYIDGRLIGALSAAWMFAKEPFAGVTPIEEMLKLLKESPEKKEGSPGTGRLSSFTGRHSAEDLIEVITLEAKLPSISSSFDTAALFSYNWQGNMFSSIPVPVVGLGLSENFMQRLNDQCRSLPVSFFQAGGSAPGKPAALEPGSVIFAKMLEGDIEFGALGTVTEIIGDRVLAFGHQLILTEIELPMAAGAISTIIPSRSLSFKMGQPSESIGKFALDSNVGALGILGPKADMIDTTVTITRMKGAPPEALYDFAHPAAGEEDVLSRRSLRFKTAKSPAVTPALLREVLYDLYTADAAIPDENVMQFNLKVDIAGHEPLVIREVFSGTVSPHYGARAIAQPVRYLMENEFERVEIKALNVEIFIWEALDVARLESMKIMGDKIEQADVLKVEITLAPYHRDKETIHVDVQIPDEALPGTRFVSVCDFQSHLRLELMENRSRFEPETIGEAIEILNIKREKTSLFLRISPERYGLVVERSELPNLPLSVLTMLGTAPKTEISPLIYPSVEKIKTSYIIEGHLYLPFTILKKER